MNVGAERGAVLARYAKRSRDQVRHGSGYDNPDGSSLAEISRAIAWVERSTSPVSGTASGDFR